MSRVKHSLARLACFGLLLAHVSAFAFTTRDANSLCSSFMNSFYSLSGTNGYFKDTQTGGSSYFWTQANIMECVNDAYEWRTNVVYANNVTNLLNGFIIQNGNNWTSWNIYNDDIMWAVIAFVRGGQLTGRTNYYAIAKANFDACYARAYDTNLGGGLYWSTGNFSKNAAVEGPAAIAAYLLSQVLGDTNYYNKATNIYFWERKVLFNTNNGAIADYISTNGIVYGGATTYNQGTFIGAANYLGQTNDARLAANFTMMQMTTGGILPQYGIAGNNSGFNAIFQRWMMRYIKNRGLEAVYGPWFQRNATAAWNLRRAPDNLSWCQWRQPTPLGTNFYSWDCVSSFEAMQMADPTQGSAALSVPRDYLVYWPLDETGGSVATNAAWSGNHGVVNGATWNASGRFGGCLTFNGVNNNVQITNPIVNDFTISFWVKTTQTAGTPQWYNGAGLVDGDVAATANDFGTALVGGKFGFGTGNPDTTIVSTTLINNGAWHHCVATRLEATGALSVYVDGALQATGTGTKNTLSSPAKLLFGSTGGNYFNGSLDDVKIFPRTLSGNEVAALYSSSVTAPSAAPTNLTAIATGNAAVQLTWSEAALATSYNLKRALVNGGPYVTLTNIVATTFTDTNVLNNRTYYYVVSPVNLIGEGTNSAPASVNTSALATWFKADAITGLTNGSPVSLWPDLTGNGFNALQILPANQPTFVTNAINGFPAVRFNSTNSNYLWFYRPVQDDFTMIFVFRSSQGIGTGLNFYEGAGLINGEQNGAVNDFGFSLNANGQILAGTGNPDTTIRSSTGYNNGLPHVVTFKRLKSNGALALYVDSTLVATGTGNTQSMNAPNFLALGAQGTLNNFLNGDIGEVQIYNAVLADADRLAQERALKCKFAMSGGATPPVPTGLTGVASNRLINLNWTLSSGASGYNLWRSTNGGASYQLAAGALTVSSFVDTNAANGQTNFYQVAATDGCGASANSAALGVFLPVPVINLIANANSLSMSWSNWATGWDLYSTTNLTPPTVWSAVTNAVVNTNGQFNVTLPMGSEIQFFRLMSP